MQTNRNALLDKHQKLFAQNRGYQNWQEYHKTRSLKDYARDVYEIAANTIEELESKLKKYE